jgi:hypothetical protein
MCIVYTAHSVTRPLNRLTTEYPTSAWPSPVLCTRSPTLATILIAVRHVVPVTYTPWDKQTWFSTRTYRGKTTKISHIWIQTMASQWLITIKPRYRPLGFSISPLMSTLTIKSRKFEFWIQDTIMFLLSTTRLARVQPTFAQSLPPWQWTHQTQTERRMRCYAWDQN